MELKALLEEEIIEQEQRQSKNIFIKNYCVDLRKIPIVFVHGYTDFAGAVEPIAEYFKKNFGYTDEELYGTSYGTFVIGKPIQTGMKCEYIKMVRVVIESVSNFTNSQVNVAGYSMGSPIGRKAILGGKCVDTGEQLGVALTSLVNAFIGVAGKSVL